MPFAVFDGHETLFRELRGSEDRREKGSLAVTLERILQRLRSGEMPTRTKMEGYIE